MKVEQFIHSCLLAYFLFPHFIFKYIFNWAFKGFDVINNMHVNPELFEKINLGSYLMEFIYIHINICVYFFILFNFPFFYFLYLFQIFERFVSLNTRKDCCK